MLTDFEAVYLYRQGNEYAWHCLFKRYKRMILKITYKIIHQYGLKDGNDVDSLQLGLIAFERCLMNYDTSRGARLPYYLQMSLKTQINTELKVLRSKKEQINQTALSLDAPVSEDGNLTYHDIFGCENRTYSPEAYCTVCDMAFQLKGVMEVGLTESEQRVVILQGKGHSYLEISELCSIDSKEVDNILQKFRRRIKRKQWVMN